VRAKNVCLSLVDDHTHFTRTGLVQLFNSPHPTKIIQSRYFSPTPPVRLMKQKQTAGKRLVRL
jgi:WD repeat-containing protein 81